MLYTKFERHQPVGSREKAFESYFFTVYGSRSFGSEEDFQRFLLYGYGGHLGHVTRII